MNYGSGFDLGCRRPASRAALSRSKAFERPASANRSVVRPEERHSLGDVTPGDGVQLGHDLLASSS